MIGRVTRCDGEHFEVVFRPEVADDMTKAEALRSPSRLASLFSDDGDAYGEQLRAGS